MSVHYKTGGAWVEADQVYVKVQGIWVEARQVHNKISGSWVKVHEYDSTPPDPPVISLEVIDTEYTENSVEKSGRYIKLGIRTPPASHDSKLKRVRVLTTYNNAAPTTQFGGTYTAPQSDADWPDEPWSDWHYNGYGSGKSHPDSSQYNYKQWPRNATQQSNLAEGRYYFSAWAEDKSGNWSAGTHTFIDLPKKSVESANVIRKEARIRANTAGSWVDGAFVSGQLEQRYANPKSRGFYFYGNEITNVIGDQGTPTIKGAQIFLIRGDDSGKPSANVYLFWHTETTSSGLSSQPTRHEATKIGTIAKGEAKWFTIPESMWPNLEADDIKGFGLDHINPVMASGFPEDYSVIKSTGEQARSGEVHLVWVERP